jgi:hypothetical protein
MAKKKEEPLTQINFDLVKDGDPVQLYAVGASISHSEKRFIKQYNGNDYFTTYQTQFSRPVSLADSKGMSSVNRQLALAMSLATQVNRKCQARDGIAGEIGPEVQCELQLTPEGKIIEGAVLPGKEVDAIRAQLASLRQATDASVAAAAGEQANPQQSSNEEAPAKATTRKRSSKKTTEEPPVETPADDMGGGSAPVEEVL